jgi:thioredoxin
MSDEKLEEIKRKKFEAYMNIRSMPKEIIHLETPESLKELMNKFPDKVIIIDFWAQWCAPCLSFAPVFEKFQKEYGNQFIFTKLNVDNNPQLAQQFGITGIPTTVFIKNGQLLRKQVGAMNYESMKMLLHKFKSY